MWRASVIIVTALFWLSVASLEYLFLETYAPHLLMQFIAISELLIRPIHRTLTWLTIDVPETHIRATLAKPTVAVAVLLTGSVYLWALLWKITRYLIEPRRTADRLRDAAENLRDALAATRQVEPVNQGLLRKRLQNTVAAQYAILNNIIKSGVLAIAATTAVDIAVQLDWSLKVSPFLVSLLMTLITYLTWLRGDVFAPTRYNLFDYILPLLIGLLEFGLFLSLGNKNFSTSIAITVWYAVAACHAFTAVLLVANRLWQTRSDDYVPQLTMFSTLYKTWLKGDLVGAALFAGIALFSALLSGWDLIPPRYASIPFVILGAMGLRVAFAAVGQLREASKHL